MLPNIKRIFILLLCVLLLSGCWGRREVNDIAIVTAIGIDLIEKDLIRVTLLLAIPRLIGTTSANGGGESKLEVTAGWVVGEQGKTVMDAYNKLQAKLPRKLFFSHNRVIVFGEKLARHGTLPTLDFFVRNRQSQLKSAIIVTKLEAADVLKFKPKFEKLASEVIRGELHENSGSTVELGRFLTMLTDEGQEAYALQISVVPSEKSADRDGSNNLMVSKGAAVFQDDRLIGWLNDTELMGLLWIRNEKHEGVVTVEIPENLGGGHVSGEITNVHSKVLPRIQKDNTQMDIQISASINISENTSELDLSASSNKILLSGLFVNEVEDMIQMLCKKVQTELKSDIFGFGQNIYKQDPQIWKSFYSANWRNTFPGIEVHTSVNLQVVQTGLIGKGAIKEEMR
ncbi:Ger(x)C family spore germination protein [Paenibacillus sp. HWE-109]|uniref:Ger(x)C family spore germination protein n=1 Tax=Paenibacillus sp. HWE-109 TaxID=1306526 RepID=UPI001EE0D819|nr:Ger(x)C family spore germination protein [Paenibacillus sp. HWE-109]UKS24500.1 Ger(x)C family spore germination protein [Paenibacillus sp. HWE-109]